MAKQKPEIDREAMFLKIMPSSYPKTVDSSEEEQAVAPPPTPVTELPKQETLLRKEVRLNQKDSRLLTNVMEYVVVDKLDLAFEKFNCCKCDKCRKDVAAIALNKLPPKYVVADEAMLSGHIALVNNNEVSTAIVQAILQVRSHPRH